MKMEASTSNENVWHSADFPNDLAEQFELDLDEYEDLKQLYVGKEVWPREAWATDARLKEVGCSSWKQYVLDKILSY